MTIKFLEYLAMVCGLIGTYAMSSKSASRSEVRLMVFSLYLVSNIGMIIAGWAHQMVGLVIMQSIYVWFSLRGIHNNWR